jgi:hypothetical protein
MNLFDLKAVCVAYHNKEPEDTIVGGADLFLTAANNARKLAEKRHNFESAWVRATLNVDYLTGASFRTATMLPTNTFQNIREVLSIQGSIDNCLRPVRFTRPTGLPASYDWICPRYPTDGEAVACWNGAGLIIRGDNIFLYPTQTQAGTLATNIEGYGWLNDYTEAMLTNESAAPQDFLIENGFDFLQWSIIIELNYRFQTFVNRQEGNVGTPSALKQEAWEDLVASDVYRLSPHLRDTR